MNLLDDAIDVATGLLAEGTPCSVIMVSCPAGVRRTFIRRGIPGAVWEADCAVDAAGGTRAVLITPIVDEPDELLHIIEVDLDWGLDLHRCTISREEDGQARVNLPEHYTGQIQLDHRSPGYVLIQALRAYREEMAA